MIGVLIVSHVRLVREGLSSLLERSSSITVLATAADVSSAVERLVRSSPDVVLIDLAVSDRLVAVREIARAAGLARLVGVGISDTEHEVIPSIEAGLSGYVTRDGSIRELIGVIETVHRDEVLYPPSVSAALARRVRSLVSRADSELEDQLTPRELQILTLITRGLSNKQIALDLQIEVATVKTHVHHILEKLHVTRRVDAAAHMRSAGPWYRGGQERMNPVHARA